jgi:hypothetical protein
LRLKITYFRKKQQNCHKYNPELLERSIKNKVNFWGNSGLRLFKLDRDFYVRDNDNYAIVAATIWQMDGYYRDFYGLYRRFDNTSGPSRFFQIAWRPGIWFQKLAFFLSYCQLYCHINSFDWHIMAYKLFHPLG